MCVEDIACNISVVFLRHSVLIHMHVDSGHAVNATLYTRRPHLPGGCCPCLERPAVICQGSSHHADVPPRTQEDIVSDVIP